MNIGVIFHPQLTAKVNEIHTHTSPPALCHPYHTDEQHCTKTLQEDFVFFCPRHSVDNQSTIVAERGKHPWISCWPVNSIHTVFMLLVSCYHAICRWFLGPVNRGRCGVQPRLVNFSFHNNRFLEYDFFSFLFFLTTVRCVHAACILFFFFFQRGPFMYVLKSNNTHTHIHAFIHWATRSHTCNPMQLTGL